MFHNVGRCSSGDLKGESHFLVFWCGPLGLWTVTQAGGAAVSSRGSLCPGIGISTCWCGGQNRGPTSNGLLPSGQSSSEHTTSGQLVHLGEAVPGPSQRDWRKCRGVLVAQRGGPGHPLAYLLKSWKKGWGDLSGQREEE